MSHHGRASGGRGDRPRRAAGVIAVLMTALSSLGTAATAASPASAATTVSHSRTLRTICAVAPKNPARASANPGAYVGGTRYRVQDDRFGTLDPKQCIALTPRGRPAWKVTVSEAHSRGNPVQAFPYIQYGCYWGWCTPGSALPLKISNIKSATSAWYTREHARGTWNTGYDLWLNSYRLTHGHANRAEVMIWLHATTPHYRVGGAAGTRKVKVAGHWFYLTHWRTGTKTIPGGWQYVQYRLVNSSWHVKKLNIKAVLDNAASRHLISLSWYLQGILAGHEIWSGGTGLATTSFSAAVQAKHPAKARPTGHVPCPTRDRVCVRKQIATRPGAGDPPVPVAEPVGP
jgi:hypothetical protein